MKTNHQTTYVLLDRGTEDVQLYRQLDRLLNKIGYPPKQLATVYPQLVELRQALRLETAGSDDDE